MLTQAHFTDFNILEVLKDYENRCEALRNITSVFLKMLNKLEARVLSEYKRSRAAPSTFCTLIKHYFSFIKHYVIHPSFSSLIFIFRRVIGRKKVFQVFCNLAGFSNIFLPRETYCNSTTCGISLRYWFTFLQPFLSDCKDHQVQMALAV